jgi:hypothetical protein
MFYSPCQATGSQPYVFDISDIQTYVFFGIQDLADGPYLVKRYEVRYDAIYIDCPLIERPFNYTPDVWGLDPFTHALSACNPNYGRHYIGVVSINEDQVTLRSFVYEVWTIDGTYIGFRPYTPENCTFFYTVVGDNVPPSVPTGLSISNDPDYHPLIQWDHNPETDLDGYKVFRWIYRDDDDFVQIGDVPAGTNYYIDYEYVTEHPGPSGWSSLADYTVLAYDSVGNESNRADSITIKILDPYRPQEVMEKYNYSDSYKDIIPDKYELLPPYPNPFNSQIKIKFNLPDESFTKIEIYNSNGQLIKTIVSNILHAHSYEVIWDATDSNGNIISGGIYLIVMTTDCYKESKKVVLIK